ncbi:MAG TPA: nucleotide exchange factor GrpE [Longimicrobium sp.]|nr:nucleotide exchange factor GrpE [Longimicrobium sp.]
MRDHKRHDRHHEAGATADEQAAGKANGQGNGQVDGGDGLASGGNGAGTEAGAQAQPAAEAGEGSRPGEAAPDAAAELQGMRERYLRLAAEFENYRKRVERERGESWVRAQGQLAERLLEPLDDLQRIADFDPATTSAVALHEGAEMVEKKFLRALEAAGLEEIDAAGKAFDPTQHEALTTAPAASEEEDDTVAQVYRKGYRFKGVLLRPAQVVVKKHG